MRQGSLKKATDIARNVDSGDLYLANLPHSPRSQSEKVERGNRIGRLSWRLKELRREGGGLRKQARRRIKKDLGEREGKCSKSEPERKSRQGREDEDAEGFSHPTSKVVKRWSQCPGGGWSTAGRGWEGCLTAI